MTTNEWDEYAADWDDDEAARAYAEAAYGSLVSVLAELGRELNGASVLDFGCGTGLLTERLVPVIRNVDAVDTSAAMLDVVQAKIARHGWNEVSAMTSPPTDPESYDLVVCSSVCSFLEDYPGTLAALVDLLVPGGVFVQWDWERDDTDDESHGLSRREIADALTAAGLVSTTVGTAFEVSVGEMTMRPLIGAGIKRRTASQHPS